MILVIHRSTEPGGIDRMSSKGNSQRAAIRVARKLVGEIRRRRLRPGTKLVAEHHMVEELGVARGTVREALRFLELQGALRIKAGPGGGPVVSVPGADHLASVLSLHLQFAGASFQSVVDARRSIYPVLAAEAAERASADDVAALKESVARLRDGASDPEFFIAEARRFMSLLGTASRNPVLALLVDALHRMSEGHGAWDERQRSAAVRSYGKAVAAIERREPEEARAIIEKSLAAAARYRERTAPDELKQPVAWIDCDR
jgi:DNA-binding FadR family transcriptional regulator